MMYKQVRFYSVFVLICNCASFMEKAVSSLLAHTHKEFPLMVWKKLNMRDLMGCKHNLHIKFITRGAYD